VQTIHIGIADDHRLFREGVSNIIRSFDRIEVVAEAANGKVLLDILAQHDREIDIVLLDLNMPEMDGVETMTRLKQQYPKIKVIVVSLHEEPPLLFKLFEMGINAYLHKDCEIDELKKAIYTVYENDIYMNQRLSEALKKMAQYRNDGSAHAEKIAMTQREKEILQLICNECTTHEIAEKLGVSVRTVEGHRTNLLQKTGSKNIVSLLIYALRHKLVDTGFLIQLK
jgi:DNA-binding NarL/FixJ family response regulator